MELAQMSATDSSDCSSLSRNALRLELCSVSTPCVWPKEISGMLMRERHSLNKRTESGIASRSLSITVPLVAITSDHGGWLAAKRPAVEKLGVRLPWCARKTNSSSSRKHNETCET